MRIGGGPILALDSSTSMGSVAVGADGRVLAEVSLSVSGGHSSALMPAVEYAMRSAGLAPADLTAIIVGSGPGSFTGLRIAGATAKGMVHALRIPLLAYSSLLATAAPFASRGGAVCAIFDARGRDVFAAIYGFASMLETPLAPAAMSLDEAIDRCRDANVSHFVGDGAIRHADELKREIGASVADAHFASPRGAALLWLAERLPDVGIVAEPTHWEPDYLRPSGAERIAAERASSISASAGP